MNKKVYYNYLYDYYKDLLTEKQRTYFEDYYFNDFSLQEIGENENVSRNAVFNQVKNVEEKLEEFESKLSLYKNGLRIRELIKDIDKEKREEIERLI